MFLDSPSSPSLQLLPFRRFFVDVYLRDNDTCTNGNPSIERHKIEMAPEDPHNVQL
jgi:hypothetical protein